MAVRDSVIKRGGHITLDFSCEKCGFLNMGFSARTLFKTEMDKRRIHSGYCECIARLECRECGDVYCIDGRYIFDRCQIIGERV